MKRHLYHLICLVGFAAVTYGFLAEMKNSGLNLNQYDKHLHFTIFFALSALLQWSYKPKLWQAVLLLASYGVAIEFLQQSFTRGRKAELWDWVADLCGVAAFYLLFYIWRIWRIRRHGHHL
ncbi:VanZ family protein [Rheinheimera sp.]|uniref:VanZ family protein n=1 Tax=Rheinheimera sp. TaxID=1869214 RepID=UPI00307CFEBC